MLIDNKYDIGDIVYLKTDEDQSMRIITSITVCINSLIYSLSLASQETQHYDFEISKEKQLIL